MPMADYRCSNTDCGQDEEQFFHHPPSEINCSSCGAIAYPFIQFDRRPEYAQRFDPIVLHRNVETGKYSFPAHAADPPDPGYEKVEIRTIRESDKIDKLLTEEATREKRENIQQERQYWDERSKDRREKIDNRMKQAGISRSQMGDMVRQYVDQKREARYRQLENRTVTVYNQALNFDSSNRQPYRDHEGKERRQ